MDAAECLDIGLVNAVVPNDELMPTAMQWAEEIADNAPMAVQTTKRMMRMGLEESYDTAVDHLMVHLNGMFPKRGLRGRRARLPRAPQAQLQRGAECRSRQPGR